MKSRVGDRLRADEAALRAGLDSDDTTVRSNAEQARENLLRCGHFELLDEEN